MNRRLLAIGLALAALVPGCITLYTDDTATVHVLVTRDVGTEVLTDAEVTVSEDATVLDALREVATVETAYGGGFVAAIDGLESRYPDEDLDWFYHVDTRLADVGAAQREVDDGDLIIWDHRPWNRSLALRYVLTGLDAWPLDEATNVTPDQLDTQIPDGTAYARTQGDRLVVLDAWGRAAERLDPPWLLVHAAPGPDGERQLLVLASDPGARELYDRLDTHAPIGVGIAITPNRTLEVPGP